MSLPGAGHRLPDGRLCVCGRPLEHQVLMYALEVSGGINFRSPRSNRSERIATNKRRVREWFAARTADGIAVDLGVRR